MRLTVLTMPAALLLLLCIACNSLSRKQAPAAADGAVQQLSRTVDDKEVFKTADTASSISGNELTAGNESAAVDEEEQPGQSPQQTPGKSPLKANPAAPMANPDWDKKIVKTADLNVEVKNYPSFTDRLHRAVKQSGGYIAQEQQTQSAYSIENTVSIKVPVDRFDDLLMQLPSDSDRLVEKKIGSEDVTMQLVDTKSRLETKKEVRERYLDLLKQARNMKDILAIQTEIDEIQEQMDAASGRISYLGHSAAFSTINLRFYQVLDAKATEDPSPSFLHKIRVSAGEGWNWCSSLLLGLVSVWPLWILIGLGWLGWRQRRHRFQKTPADSQARS